MFKKQKYQTITWIDSENPTKDEAREMMGEFNLEPEIAQDILLPTFKDKITVHKDYIYLVLHFPAFKHTHSKSRRQEIDFVIGKNFIISNRYDTIDAMEKYAKIFEVNAILGKDNTEIGSGEMFLSMMQTVYQSLSEELDSINYLLREAERNIFSGKEREMVFELSRIGRELVNFSHIITPHGEILESFKVSGGKMLGEKFTLELSDIINEYYKISKILENITDVLHELRSTNDSLLSTKQNQTMKVLTVFTFLALPFTVITSFFQINTAITPIALDDTHGWYFVVGVEIIVTTILFLIAKKKNWF